MTRVAGTPATELAKESLHAIHAVRLDFSSGIVAAHDGVGSFDYNGDTYLGVGEFGGIEQITEDIAVRPQTISLQLTGVDPAVVSDVLDDDYHLRQAMIFLIVLDEAGAVLGDPVLLWLGYMDNAVIELGENTATVSLSCMDRLADLNRPRAYWLTDEAQQRRYSGDLGLEYAPQSAKEVRLVWGGREIGGVPPGGGGGGDYEP